MKVKVKVKPYQTCMHLTVGPGYNDTFCNSRKLSIQPYYIHCKPSLLCNGWEIKHCNAPYIIKLEAERINDGCIVTTFITNSDITVYSL